MLQEEELLLQQELVLQQEEELLLQHELLLQQEENLLLQHEEDHVLQQELLLLLLLKVELHILQHPPLYAPQK